MQNTHKINFLVYVKIALPLCANQIPTQINSSLSLQIVLPILVLIPFGKKNLLEWLVSNLPTQTYKVYISKFFVKINAVCFWRKIFQRTYPRYPAYSFFYSSCWWVGNLAFQDFHNYLFQLQILHIRLIWIYKRSLNQNLDKKVQITCTYYIHTLEARWYARTHHLIMIFQ